MWPPNLEERCGVVALLQAVDKREASGVARATLRRLYAPSELRQIHRVGAEHWAVHEPPRTLSAAQRCRSYYQRSSPEAAGSTEQLARLTVRLQRMRAAAYWPHQRCQWSRNPQTQRSPSSQKKYVPCDDSTTACAGVGGGGEWGGGEGRGGGGEGGGKGGGARAVVKEVVVMAEVTAEATAVVRRWCGW